MCREDLSGSQYEEWLLMGGVLYAVSEHFDAVINVVLVLECPPPATGPPFSRQHVIFLCAQVVFFYQSRCRTRWRAATRR